MFTAILTEKRRMRLDGDGMVIGIKDAAKMIGVSIIACCAVFVCTMFMNYYLDITGIEGEIVSGQFRCFLMHRYLQPRWSVW